MFKFNPFSSPRAEEIYRKVTKLKQDHPGLSRRELAEKIIRDKCYWCAVVGIFTALPAIFPGVGTIFALIGGVTTDITLLTYLLANMVLEIAAVYSRNLTGWSYRREAFLAFTLAAGAGSLGAGLSRTVVAQLSKEAFSTLAERLLISLGVRTTARTTVVRLIPLLGLFLAGGFNYWLARAAGNRATAYYENLASPEQSKTGDTLDVDYTIK